MELSAEEHEVISSESLRKARTKHSCGSRLSTFLSPTAADSAASGRISAQDFPHNFHVRLLLSVRSSYRHVHSTDSELMGIFSIIMLSFIRRKFTGRGRL